MVGALLVEPADPSCAAGVIFFNNVGYLGMCGHGTIGLVVTLAHLGRIKPGEHQHRNAGRRRHHHAARQRRSVRGQRAQLRAKQSRDRGSAGIGQVTGDVAWGGNWFFLVGEHGHELSLANVESLTDFYLARPAGRERAGLPRSGSRRTVRPAARGRRRIRGILSCAPARPMTARPAAPAPAPSWPAWPRRQTGRRRAVGAGKHLRQHLHRPIPLAGPRARENRCPSSPARRTSMPSPRCCWTKATRSAGASGREPALRTSSLPARASSARLARRSARGAD